MRDYTRRQFLADATTMSALVTVPKVFAQDSRISDAPAFKPATELARMIRDGEISSVELTQYFIDRIEKYDDTLNAVVVRDFDRALNAAKAADDALSRGEIIGPLHGLPMTIKESYNIAGLPTTWGIPAFRDNIAETDAAVVSRYKAAGAHFMGKTNVPVGLADAQSFNDIYGTTNNPWDVGRTPGGSSGGSAAALAAGLTGLESGSDLAGSIRNPAHFCGVYGHKPTWGIISGEGHSLPGSGRGSLDLAVVGPLARSADDLSLALDILGGPEALNENGWQLDLPEPRAHSLREFRVAVWPTDEVAPVDHQISDRIEELARRLSELGAKVSSTARPGFSSRESRNTFLTLLGAFTNARMSDEVYEQAKSRAAGFAASDMSFEAVLARGAVMDHREWSKFNEIRTQIRFQWKRFFEDWDILLCPIMVTTAYPHDHKPKENRIFIVNGEEVSYIENETVWAGLINVAYLPSTVFPTGISEDGLPIGVQAISAEFNDRTTIEFARLIAREIGGFTPPMGYEDRV